MCRFLSQRHLSVGATSRSRFYRQRELAPTDGGLDGQHVDVKTNTGPLISKELQSMHREVSNVATQIMRPNGIALDKLNDPAHGSDWVFATNSRFDDPWSAPDVRAAMVEDGENNALSISWDDGLT